MSDLRKWVKPEVDAARLARQWSAIASHAPSRSRAWLALPVTALALALALAMAVVLVVTRRHETASSVAAAPAVSSSGVLALGAVHVGEKQTTFELADGSHVVAEPGADLAFTGGADMRVELRAGAVELEVKHDPERRFVVVAHAVTIVDTGTRFRVEIDEHDDVHVAVHEGSVRIERASQSAAELRAGETWGTSSAPTASAIPTASVPPIATHAPDPAAEAKRLFEAGDASRLSNHPADAARAFDALRMRYRTDPHAGLAAMELGRLRQDVLHDPRGAEEAFRDAIALAPDAPFREDAEARRVAVLDSLGDRAACASARDGYLLRYPAGLHATSVSRRCAEH